MGKNISINLGSYRCNPDFLFKIGTKHVEKRAYGTALKYLSKAAEIKPRNAVYQFNLACVLAELKQSKKSNDILINIVNNIDPLFTECYFGIGCNYFDTGNLKKAKEYFEKYLCFDSEGEFIDEVYSILYYLEILEGVPYKRLGKTPGRWRKEWESVIECAFMNKEYIYKRGYKRELKNIWISCMDKIYPDSAPVIKKREVWAAALEYIYCNLHLIRITKKKLAQKYNISPSALANKLKDLEI